MVSLWQTFNISVLKTFHDSVVTGEVHVVKLGPTGNVNQISVNPTEHPEFGIYDYNCWNKVIILLLIKNEWLCTLITL